MTNQEMRERLWSFRKEYCAGRITAQELDALIEALAKIMTK